MARDGILHWLKTVEPTPYSLAVGTSVVMCIGLIDVLGGNVWEVGLQWFGVVIALMAVTLLRTRFMTLADVKWWSVPASAGWLSVQLLLDVFVRHGISLLSYLTFIIMVIFSASAYSFGISLIFLVVGYVVLSSVAFIFGQFDLGTMNYVSYTAGISIFLAYFSHQVSKVEARATRAEQLIQRNEETGLLTYTAGLIHLKEMTRQPEVGSSRVAVILVHVKALRAIQHTFGYSTVQHVMQMVSVRLLQLCGPKDVVCHWDDHTLMVGLRNVNRVELEGRVNQMDKALTGMFWEGGPPIAVKVESGLAVSQDDLTELVDHLAHRVKTE